MRLGCGPTGCVADALLSKPRQRLTKSTSPWVDVQMFVVVTKNNWRPGYSRIFTMLQDLPHLQMLTIKRKGPATGTRLPTVHALELLVTPRLTDLNIDVGLPPAEQVLPLSCHPSLKQSSARPNLRRA